VAAVGWIWNRVTGEANVIERAMELAAEFAPLAIIALALIAVPAYWRTSQSSLEGTH
jgi:hypothetical protein